MITWLKKNYKKYKALQFFVLKYRYLRLYIKAIFKLPKQIRIPIDKKSIWINTRNWQTANFCMGRVKDNILLHEPEGTEIFKKMVKNAQIVFDIGAHIGYYSLIAAAFGVKKVVAFEIHDAFTKILLRHAKANCFNNIQIINRPVGLSGKEITFENYGVKTKKTAISLDEFCDNLVLYPEVIKIDVEGYEYDVLQGGYKMLSKTKPLILLGLHPKKLLAMDYNTDQVLNLLINSGYFIYPIVAYNFGIKKKFIAKNRKDIENELFRAGNIDLFCVPKEKEELLSH